MAGFVLALTACGGGSAEDREPSASPRGTLTGQTTSVMRLPKIEGAAPTPGGLVGTWSRIGSAGLIRFGADGEFRMARNEPDLVDAPFAVGTYEVKGSTITFLSAGGGTCSGVVWEAGLSDEEDRLDEELHVASVNDGCGLTAGTELRLVRISTQ